MKVGNSIDQYSEEWDKLLNYILKNHVSKVVDKYIMRFKVPTGKWFIFTTYTYYEVWISNKKFGYGSLYKVNYTEVPRDEQYRPTQETLEKLYDFEQGYGYRDFYKIPNTL